jgi:hypothetical protein
VWRALQQEYAWVFRWMQEPQRVCTAPLFVLAELRTIGICLRRQKGGLGVDDGLLQGSLLAERIRHPLGASLAPGETVERLAGLLAPVAPACGNLGQLFRQGGCGAVERGLEEIFLEQLAAGRLHPVLRRLVGLLADGCNLTAVAKGLRWRLSGPPRLIAGGSIPPKQLEALYARRDTAAVARLATGLAGSRRSGGEEEIEQTVLMAQYRQVRSMAREPSGIGAIVDYLWRCRNEARTIGLLSRLATAGVAAVDGEIVA